MRWHIVAALAVAVTLSSGFNMDAASQATAIATAASDCSPTPTEVKAMALQLSAANVDGNAFIIALDRAFGFDTAFLSQHPAVPISTNDAISVLVLFPYPTYRLGVMEANRKRNPIDDVVVPVGVTVSVSPSRIDSPDIIKVVVERNGKPVSPIANLLKPTTLETRLGAKAVLHSGVLVFPCSAFAPGARVHVTAIPETGANIERDMPGETIGYYPKQIDTSAVSLLKLSAAEVETRLGKPNHVDGHRWTYTTSAGRLVLYFDDSNAVTDVQPRMFDLSAFRK